MLGVFGGFCRDGDLTYLADTTAGVKRRTGESDASLNKRYDLKQQAQGAAGTRSGYHSQALEASDDVVDAYAASDEQSGFEGRIKVSILATEAASKIRTDTLLGEPEQTLIDTVQTYLRDDERVLVGYETLVVAAPALTEYLSLIHI